MRTPNFGWLVPLFAKARPRGPTSSAGYLAPPTVAVPLGSRGSETTGIRPVGREYGSELKWPALIRYDQRSFGACDVVTPAPKVCPAPRPTVDPASRSKYPALNVT